ncbi:uncharacterized protein LOC132725504 [Ruditapes philippinarum]|uniref:uncharacterized protein LOC132725504 n=1 Tax=Ruditapes philippinarum TaxID=129788 RepID=UPI00295BF08E|nr:uncharacterized protein LOC132725504 [Ruditapes philippinarum]
MQVILQQRNEAAEKHLKLESNAVSRYPACMYNAMCSTSRKMVSKQKIKSDTENCWIIENVIIAECDLKFEHDFSCAKFEIPEAVGVGCFQSFFHRNVLAFCLGPPKKNRLNGHSNTKYMQSTKLNVSLKSGDSKKNNHRRTLIVDHSTISYAMKRILQ